MHTLQRTDYRPDGIFSKFTFEDDDAPFCVTLEHSYNGQPKVQSGIYKCVRGIHALHDGVPFTTFEIMGVEGHSGILFHVGNFNKDSEGCVLVGQHTAIDPNSGQEIITGSKVEFAAFMERLAGVIEFQLQVIA